MMNLGNLYATLELYLKEFGESETVSGYAFAVYCASSAAIALIIGYWFIVALIMMGMSASCAFVTVMIKTMETCGFPVNVTNSSICAAVWATCYAIGEIVGPFVAGTLLENFGAQILYISFATINVIAV
ncbi:hypothetical protein B4U80_14089 [Leptotrombidium deliense]|uniref:Uncharacterized protein n=1 Tax=Leptotrombidium deliense TaxID=299467 RepID=A0A443S2Y5_9ACAR|nr:hypothetical protein B4U80_14089 [Leptotrombidium deliense]